MVHPSKDLGVIFTLMFFLVILITNVTVRGLSSVVVILALVLGVVLVLYFGWWDSWPTLVQPVSIHMNMGFYVCFSTMIFLVWAISTFVYDRLSYWRVTPGQITHEFLIGGAAKSYDTRGMVFEKHRNDLFRHWILGIGSGDLNISTTGAQKQGFHSFLGQNRTQFSISFFIFALLFLLFDLEILLVYPYVVSSYTNGIYGLMLMLIFFLVLNIRIRF